jgi:hypothetical protein
VKLNVDPPQLQQALICHTVQLHPSGLMVGDAQSNGYFALCEPGHVSKALPGSKICLLAFWLAALQLLLLAPAHW